MRLDAWLRDAEARLSQAEIESPRLEAQVLAGHLLGQSRSWVAAHPEAEIEGSELVERRALGEPLAYILGWREFYGRRFAVSPSVLIPRHETETLVEAALARPWRRALDVGTGSGCLAITLKLERPEAEIWAVDISPDALETAEANARELGAEIQFSQGDLFFGLEPPFDLIISNPPYVAAGDALPQEVSAWEPDLALYAEEDGYAIYRRLAEEAPSFLSADGCLILELGDHMVERARGIFEGAGWLVEEVVSDLGGTARALVARLRRAVSSW